MADYQYNRETLLVRMNAGISQAVFAMVRFMVGGQSAGVPAAVMAEDARRSRVNHVQS